MKRRLIIGLTFLFAVVLVGGGITAILMDELSQLDQVQYQMDKLGGQVTDIHIGILESVRLLKEAPEDEKRILALSERMSRSQSRRCSSVRRAPLIPSARSCLRCRRAAG